MTILEMIFDLNKTNVMPDIRYLKPAVRQSIPIPTKKICRFKKLKTIQELQEFFSEIITITNGIEQQIPRPKDKRKRKTHYSCKKTYSTKLNYD